MANTLGSRLARLALAASLWLVAVLAGCDGHSPASSAGSESSSSKADDDGVCPSCRAGGETGDFGAGIASCAQSYATRDVDRDEADALGFPASAVARVIEKPIDAKMTWAAIDSSAGGPASGYEPETRVHVALSLDKLVFYEIDPDKCSDPECMSQVEEGGCRPVIMVNASGELHTSDGAVAADLPLQAVRVLRPEDDDLGVAARADLREVRGSLKLDPAIPEPRKGVLDLSLVFTAERTFEFGLIDISIYPDRDHLPDGGPRPTPELSRYTPLQGRWGSPPPLPGPITGGQPQP